MRLTNFGEKNSTCIKMQKMLQVLKFAIFSSLFQHFGHYSKNVNFSKKSFEWGGSNGQSKSPDYIYILFIVPFGHFPPKKLKKVLKLSKKRGFQPKFSKRKKFFFRHFFILILKAADLSYI